MKIVSKSLEETKKAAGSFLEAAAIDRRGRLENAGAQIAGLVGDLGAGKTAFVQKVAEILDVKEVVTSPTFVIMKVYDLPAAPAFGWRRLIHIDAYRLQNGEELMKLNFAELAENSENLILIEWPENVASALAGDYQKVYFKFIDENRREIEF